ERRPGGLPAFTRDDSEADRRRGASGGFAPQQRWRTECAVESSSFHLSLPFLRSSDVNCLIEEAAQMEKIKFQQPLGVVMEFMANGSLEKMLPTHSLGWQLKVCTIHETSLTMNFLHSIKPPLLHLDLKPGNILLDSCLHVKVSDFGLSKRMEQSTWMQCIKRSALQGTLSYSPPEMFLESNKGLGPKYDMYSFGIVIWEILSGPPLTCFNVMTIITQVATGRRPSLQPVSDKSQQMVDLMRPCWDQEPKKRPCFPDIIAETDMLLSLLQSPVAHREREALAGKMSCAAASPGRSDSGDYLKWVLRLSDSESLVPSDEQVCSYENKGVRLLLAHEVDVDRQTACGYTPLLIAAQDQQDDFCTPLLEHSADAHLADEDSWAPLHFAAQNGDDHSAHPLLDQENCVMPRSMRGGPTPPECGLASGLPSRGRVGCSAEKPKRPLHLTVERGKVRATQHLPLPAAGARGKYLICKMLLGYGAILELPTQQGWTPPHLAAYKGHLEIIHLLAESQADVGAPRGMNWIPLHLAAHHKAEVVVSTLLKCGADCNAAEQSGWTPLHLAVQSWAFLSIIHLLEHRADVHACNKVGWPPAHLAALKGNMAIFKVPVKAGTQLDIQEGVGCTPLQLALQSQKQDIVAFPEGRKPSLAILGRAEPGAQMEV
uniref:Ankyrin repeat and kinase domain containing 1 n=1 Tax=Capra hircus TaxID=9925 RepID=A0A452FWT2_CAPHI